MGIAIGAMGACTSKDRMSEADDVPAYDARDYEITEKHHAEKYHPIIQDYIREHPFDDIGPSTILAGRAMYEVIAHLRDGPEAGDGDYADVIGLRTPQTGGIPDGFALIEDMLYNPYQKTYRFVIRMFSNGRCVDESQTNRGAGVYVVSPPRTQRKRVGGAWEVTKEDSNATGSGHKSQVERRRASRVAG